MSLIKELHFNNSLKLLPHEVLLNIYHTAGCLKKEADRLFREYGVTDVQFNLMMLLRHQSDKQLEGINQADLSRMMLVNRANITSLIDRMEKAGLVKRTAAPNDRRSNIIKLTDLGNKVLDKVEPIYADRIIKTMHSFNNDEQNMLIHLLEKVRQGIGNK